MASHTPRARFGSRPRDWPTETPPNNPPRFLESKAVTFDLVTAKNDEPISSPYAEHIYEPHTTTVSLSTVSSQELDETVDSHSPNDNGLAHDSSIRLPRFFHVHDPETLANRIASAITNYHPDSRGFIPAGTLDHFLEKRVMQRTLEHLVAQAQNQQYSARRKISAGWRQMIKATVTKSPRPSRTTAHEDAMSSVAEPKYDRLRKIFATLLLIGHPQLIFDFLKVGMEDTDLPVRGILADPDQDSSLTSGLCVKDCLSSTSLPAARTRCLKGWTVSCVKQFEAKQWVTLSPVFSAGAGQKPIHYSFEGNIILPFTSCQSISSRGSRVEILKVRIHTMHHNFDRGEWSILSTLTGSESDSPFFAVKRIANREEFDREVNLLKRVIDPHVIGLFATYEQSGIYHLIMPWAECNLEQFWQVKMPETASDDSSTLRWVARQCLGVASALRQVQHHLTFSRSSLFGYTTETHGSHVGRAPNKMHPTPRHAFFGRHGDIKPQNLLWFPIGSSNSRDTTNLGIIKICDFGEGEFNKSQSVHRSTDSISYTPSYRPPECDHPDKEVEVNSGTYDTWSLGCLYLEFITWYLGGWKSILAFEKSRSASDGKVPASARSRHPSSYFEATGLSPPEPHARIKSSVEEHCKMLRGTVLRGGVGTANHGETGFLYAFLNLIQRYMLVINPDGHEPHDGGSYRMSCNHIHEKLGDMGRLIGVMDDEYDDEETSRHRIRHLLEKLDGTVRLPLSSSQG